MLKISRIGMMVLPAITFATDTFEKNWSGKYLGGNVGGIFNNINLQANQIALGAWDGQCQRNTSFSSAFIGGQYGIQKQYASNLTFGVEGDYTFNLSQSANTSCDCDINSGVYDGLTARNHYQASIKGRLGYAAKHNLQPFFAAGVSFAELGMAYANEVHDTYSHNQIRPGFVVGGGLDWAHSEHWNLRLEYYYNQYNALNLGLPSIYQIYDAAGLERLNLSSNNIRAGINYWF